MRFAKRRSQNLSRRGCFARQHGLPLAMPLTRMTPHLWAMWSARAPVLEPREPPGVQFALPDGVIDRRLCALDTALRTRKLAQPALHAHVADAAQYRPESYAARHSRRSTHPGQP